MTAWKYSNQLWLERFKLGLEHVTNEELSEEFIKWNSTREYTFLKKVEDGKVIHCLNSKRGNETYAKKQKIKFDEIQNALLEKKLDFPAEKKGFRNTTLRYTFGIFLTFTIDQKQYTQCEAWEALKGSKSILNQFKAYLTKYLGCEYSSFTVKEGTKDGYPAPHMMIILDKPVLAFLHHSKVSNNTSWRIQDREIVNILQEAWARYSKGSFIDIQAICGGAMGSAGTVAYYLSKYMGKSIDPKNKTAVLTHAYQKLFNLRDIVSKSFKERLNIDTTALVSRLDCYYNELKPLLKKLNALERKIGNFRGFYPIETKEYYNLLRQIEEIEENKPPPDWIYLDGYTVKSPADIQGLLDRIHLYKVAV